MGLGLARVRVCCFGWCEREVLVRESGDIFGGGILFAFPPSLSLLLWHKLCLWRMTCQIYGGVLWSQISPTYAPTVVLGGSHLTSIGCGCEAGDCGKGSKFITEGDIYALPIGSLSSLFLSCFFLSLSPQNPKKEKVRVSPNPKLSNSLRSRPGDLLWIGSELIDRSRILLRWRFEVIGS